MRKQVVLLFDLHCLGWDAPGDAAFEWRLRSLQRATLRLLLGLANCLEKDGGLRFGFRLFDSARYKPGTDRSGFVDFTLDAFEALENSLAGALERRRTGSPRRAADPGAAPPGQALTRALHEVLSDFQWERADVDSPVKRPRRRRGAAPAPADDSGNAVYLVAALPAAEEAAHRFAGGAAPDELPARLTAAVLSDSFRRLLCEQCRVRLHVLDTAGLQTAAEPDPLVQRAFSALAEATGGVLTRLETLLELCGPEPAAEPAPEVGPGDGKAAAEGEGLRVRWRMGPTEYTARVTIEPGAKADAPPSDRTLLRLLSSPDDACILMEVVAKMTDAVDNASHVQLATFEAGDDAFSAGTLLLVRLSDQPCLLRTDSARRGALLSLGDPPTDGGAGARKDAETVRHRLRSERPLVADMLQLWFVGPPPESPPKHQDVWPTPSEQWPEGLNALLARSLRHRRARGSSSSAVPAAAGSAPPAGPAPVAAAAPGGLQRGHQMMARAAQMTAVRQRRGQRQQAAEQQRQTWRRQEKERRMREQQQRALRDVSGVTDTAELVGRLQAMKERCIAGHEQDVVAAVQSVINPLLLHIKAMEGVDTASHLRLMLKDHFLPDKRRVAQLYGDDRARRVREYQYEVVVLLEACWVLGGEMSEGDKEQLLDLLRMTSLHGSPAAMTEFMELTMVESYQHTQPDLLLELYEELCQPPPAALLQLLSPSRAPPDSWRPPSSSRPPGSSGGPPGSVSSLLSGSGPGSQAVLLARSAALSRQPSLLDAAKKRQIMVPKPKELSRHASHSSGSSRSMVLASAAAARGAAAAAARAGPSSGSAQRPPSGSKTGEKRSLSSGRVKRNLFESLGRSPRRSQQGATRTAVSPQRRSLNSSFVPETPAQKNRTRRRTDSGTAVVKESPEAKEADGDVGLTPRRASQRLTLTRRASFYNLEEGSRHFARARHTVLAERLQQSAPAPTAASRLPADPQHCRPLITRLFGERGRTESAESASSLAWGLDSLSPPAGPADGAEGDGPGDPGGGDIDVPGDPGGGDGDGPGRVPDTPNRRVQFDLTPAKGGARSAARSRTPRSILKATPGCLSSPDLFGTPRKATPRANAKRKRLFTTTPSKAERGTPPPPSGAGAEAAGPSGSGLLSSPVAGVELAEDPMERTPDRVAARAALLGTPLKKVTVVLSPLNSPHRRLMSPRRSVSVAITRLSPRRTAAAPGTPPRSGKLRASSKSPVARFRPDLGTPSKRTLSLSPSVVRTPPRAALKAVEVAKSSVMEPVEAESELMTPTKPAPDGESESRLELPQAEDEPESTPSSPVISRGRSRSRSGSAPRGLRRHSPALLAVAGDGLGTPARAPQRTPTRSPPRTPSRSPGRDAHQTPTRTSPRRHQTHTPPRNRDVTPAPSLTETPPRPEVRTPPPTEPQTPPRTPQRTPIRSGDGSPHKSPVVKPDLQTGAELVLRSPAKDAPPPRQRSVSPDIGPAGDGLGAALLARFGPPVGATSTPTIAPARVGAVAAPWEDTSHFSPPRMATDSGEESPVKIDITGILDLLDEPIESPTSAMSTAEFVSVMESYLENTAESTMHSVPDLCLTDIAELEAAAEGIDFGALTGQEETPVLMAETSAAPPADSLAQAVEETAMETAATEAATAEVAETVVQSDPRVRPCYVLLSPLQWPPSAAARPGPRRTSRPPSRALRYSRSRALRHSLSEVLAARAAPLLEHGADVQVRRSASAGDQWVLSESTAAVQGESFDSSRLGDRVSDVTRNQSIGVRESGESFVASSTGGNDNSGSRGGIGDSLGLISIRTDSVWNSTASSGVDLADSDARLAANVSCQSRGGFDQSERVGSELNHLSLSGAGDGPTADAALLEAECQSAEAPERSDRSTASRTASENETTSSASSPERPRRRKKRARSEVSSSGPQTEDSQREDGEDTQRGVRQLRSGRALPENATPPSGGQGNGSLVSGDEAKRGAGAARTSADVARTYSRRKIGRRRKRARLGGSQPTSDAARSADSDRTGEESRQEKPAASRLVSEPNEDSRTSSDTGRLPATPLPETPIPRRNGSLVNVTPSKEPTDTWQVTALSARKLSPNSNRDSPSIRMRFRLTASSVSSTASQSPSRFKCLDSPDSGQEDSDAVFVNERDGMSSSDERMWSASPNASQSTPSQSKRTRLSQSPVSRSQPHNRSKKIKKRVFEPRPADSGSSVEHNSRLSNPDSELGQDEAVTRIKPTAGASRRRGKSKKSRSTATSAGAGSSSRTGSTEEVDGAAESERRGRTDGVSRGDGAAELAARLEQVKRQTLRDLRRPGGRESPDGERSRERRVEGTPESNRQVGRESGNATPLIKDIPELAGMAASQSLTPVSAKRKRLTLCDSDDESSDGPPLELKIERHDSQTRKRPNDDESSDGPPLELKIERHDSQTRKWPKEELLESFPDGLKIKKRPRYTVTSARPTLQGTPTTNGEERALTVLENKMNANHLIAGDSRGEAKRKKKSKRPRPEPLALPAGAETVGADGSASSPSLTPSTRGKRKEVSYAEFSEDDEAVFQLMGEARISPPEEPSEGHSRGGIRSRRDGQASHASHTSAAAAAGAPTEHPADLPAPVQPSRWQPPLPSSLPLRTPPRQRLTRNRIQDMGLGLDEVNALVVSPLTPLASRAAGSSSKKTFTPPTALSLLNLTSSPIMAQVRPAKRVRRALHH